MSTLVCQRKGVSLCATNICSFNCLLPAFKCYQYANCNEFSGKCNCPAGFGGEDCLQPGIKLRYVTSPCCLTYLQSVDHYQMEMKDISERNRSVPVKMAGVASIATVCQKSQHTLTVTKSNQTQCVKPTRPAMRSCHPVSTEHVTRAGWWYMRIIKCATLQVR